MALLALACVILGVAPSLVLAPLEERQPFDLTARRADMNFDWSIVVANDNFGCGSRAVVGSQLGLFAFLAAIPLALRLLGVASDGAAPGPGAAGVRYRRRALNTPPRPSLLPSTRLRAVVSPGEELDIEFHPESRYCVRTITRCNQER